eukprot:TRINITY_DN3072_c0_g2_i1.p1 TRINITY_DN3072_c0_g2~~TRINITY_DN3072_c0_g2_i1.p1  ORF type:complete len:123 (+),score=3.78 TRINITY_DN3072_c0_g2_i1:144-512(+)
MGHIISSHILHPIAPNIILTSEHNNQRFSTAKFNSHQYSVPPLVERNAATMICRKYKIIQLHWSSKGSIYFAGRTTGDACFRPCNISNLHILPANQVLDYNFTLYRKLHEMHNLALFQLNTT